MRNLLRELGSFWWMLLLQIGNAALIAYVVWHVIIYVKAALVLNGVKLP